MKPFTQRFRTISLLEGFPWLVVGLILVAALFPGLFQPAWYRESTALWQITFWAASLLGIMLLYLVASRIVALVEDRRKMQKRVEEAEGLVEAAYQRLQAIFRVSQKFVEASEESEIIELVLRLAVDLVGAKGASFVPLDEHGQPQTAVNHGELPFPVLTAWMEYLASPAIRERCRTCENHAALTTSCPLLEGPFSSAIGMFCLPLRRGDCEFGVLNLFIPDANQLDTESKAFLQALIDETALALEGVRLRNKEQQALQQMQALRQKTDLTALLTSLLENVYKTLEASYAVLIVKDLGGSQAKVSLGEIAIQNKTHLDEILQNVTRSGKPVLLDQKAGDPGLSSDIRSLLAVPLMAGDRSVAGAVLVGSQRSGSFHQRQLALLQTVSGQVSLLVQNAKLMAEVEYNAVIAERTRLAREIHDGLAQTLGFLKLQAAQMNNYLSRNEIARLRQSLDLSYSTLSEAYQDVRQAIDGLRIYPDESGLAGWIEQTVSEFEEVSGLSILLKELDVRTALPPEIHAQLIRIVQEALSNIRKHAQAKHVWICCRETGGDLILEIRDDGRGFSPEDVPAPSQHGLRGMRERAELIGADFQVISCPQDGTTIRVRLPLVGLPGIRLGALVP